MSARRLLIVSNRLPITAQIAEGAVRLEPASGGLVTGLAPWRDRSEGLWIGWPGDVSRFAGPQRAELDRLLAARRIVPIHLSRDQIERYYHGFANRVLWPSFHYQIDRVPIDAPGWDAYRAVNERFADVVAREYRDGDAIWVHDYHLMLLPALLRERQPEARIGFFLHIPFPSSEVFRTLPWRREILNGLLGADLIGFHTFAYMRHFVSSLLHVDGVEAQVDRVRIGDREIKLGVFPMGIDEATFAALAQDPEVTAEAAAIRREAGGRQILLGVDRLDYTKGIPRRLEAVGRMLVRHPELRDRVRFIQVAVPSRQEIDSYQRFRRQVEEIVGRINGCCGTLASTPIHYIHRAVSVRELVALYCAADVMLVTPLRDGMNLVAKEFVASRINDDGVLVLSEFAGAAAELCGAVVVNPYDVETMADIMRRALEMSVDEQRTRMRAMRQRVAECDVTAWAAAFLSELHGEMPAPRSGAAARVRPSLASAIAAARKHTHLRLLLDYDGTLVPLARSPQLAAPDAMLLKMLAALALAPRLDLAIVSGRPRRTLEEWFGHLPIGLWAEHGFWHRPRPGVPWQASAHVSADWFEPVRPILEQFTASTPGSRLEIKDASLAWHYRGVPREFGARQAHELRMLLGDALSNQPLEVLEGKKVIEVRCRGINKGIIAERSQPTPAQTVIAFGDDRTDEDLFRSLPESSITVAVGARLAGAKYSVESCRSVRKLLASLVTEAAASASDRAFVPMTSTPRLM